MASYSASENKNADDDADDELMDDAYYRYYTTLPLNQPADEILLLASHPSPVPVIISSPKNIQLLNELELPSNSHDFLLRQTRGRVPIRLGRRSKHLLTATKAKPARYCYYSFCYWYFCSFASFQKIIVNFFNFMSVL